MTRRKKQQPPLANADPTEHLSIVAHGLQLSQEPCVRPGHGPQPVWGWLQNHAEPCDTCGATGCAWDRIGYQHVGGNGRKHESWRAVCPDCQEGIIKGEAKLQFGLSVGLCAACDDPFSSEALRPFRKITPVLTFPLGTRRVLSISLCPQHFHAFLGRRLEIGPLIVLSRRLHWIGLCPRRVFLLHEGFYDRGGLPLQPVLVEA